VVLATGLKNILRSYGKSENVKSKVKKIVLCVFLLNFLVSKLFSIHYFSTYTVLQNYFKLQPYETYGLSFQFLYPALV